ncbi:MAG: VPLPA-CTERM-specific exosortase XrtD [Pseudomonadota bacterium]
MSKKDAMTRVRALDLAWVVCVLLGLAFSAFIAIGALIQMEAAWGREEYSHAYLIPLIAILLLLQKWPSANNVSSPSWLGLGFLAVSLFTILIGELSALYTIVQYGFIATLGSLLLLTVGWKAILLLWGSIIYLLFMVPLPDFLLNNLSHSLQLVSSEIGVFVIRLFGISVFLEGNVIDLGTMKLQVVDACSGLRYLFPLSSFGFLIAYLYQAALWQRAIIFLSTIPITVLMNSFRIGVIGVLVEYWGPGQAEGFLHYFEGWIIFIACLSVLLLEMIVLHKLSGSNGSVLDRLDLSFPELTELKIPQVASIPKLAPMLGGVALIAGASIYLAGLDERREYLPERNDFLQFPLFNKGWIGREARIEADVLSSLKLTDHIIADYTHPDYLLPVNFYVAYYESQRKGASVHSPRSCIPGGGWEIQSLDQIMVDATPGQSTVKPLIVNRVMIQKGRNKQLVYYWFKQRDRLLTNEYLVKWYLFWDSLTKSRTDGSLVRVVIPIPDGFDVDAAEDQLVRFIQDFYPTLPQYLPD